MNHYKGNSTFPTLCKKNSLAVIMYKHTLKIKISKNPTESDEIRDEVVNRWNDIIQRK